MHSLHLNLKVFVYFFSCLVLFSCSTSSEKQGLNSAPEFEFFEVQPSQATTTDIVYCSYFAKDDNNDPLMTSLEWKHLGTGQFLGEQRQLQLSPNLVQPYDTISCSVTVQDTSGLVVAQTGIVNIQNTNPIIENLRISPTDSIYRDQKLYCDATVYDIDGDEPNVFWQWLRNGESIGNSTNNLQLNIEDFSIGDQITCVYKAVDQIPSESIEEVSVVIENALPHIDSLEIIPQDVFNQNEITCNALGTVDIDQDEISIQYTWKVNGILLSEETQTLFVEYPVDSEISCSAVPFDGIEYGSTVETSITVQNTLPEGTVAIFPTEVFTTTKIQCTQTIPSI